MKIVYENDHKSQSSKVPKKKPSVANSLESSMLVAIIQAILSRPPKVLRFCIATLEVQQLAD